MGQIQSSVGLISGVPIFDTVDKLIGISARPRDLIIARNQNFQAEQIAITQLTSLALGVKLATDQLGNESLLFDEKAVDSSDPDLLSCHRSWQSSRGEFSFHPSPPGSGPSAIEHQFR